MSNIGIINNVEYSFFIERVFVRQHDTISNAISRVNWVCTLTRNGAKLIAGGQTDLDVPDADLFIEITDVEASQVIDWVINKEGGKDWLSGFITVHEEALQQAEKDVGLEGWHIPLINPLKWNPSGA